jgi:hypothetical protein
MVASPSPSLGQQPSRLGSGQAAASSQKPLPSVASRIGVAPPVRSNPPPAPPSVCDPPPAPSDPPPAPPLAGRGGSGRGVLFPPHPSPLKPLTLARKRRFSGWGLFAWAILILIVITLILTVPALIALGRAGAEAYAAKAEVANVAEAFQNRQFDTAIVSIDRAEESLRSARTALGGIGFWRNAPYVGTQVRALESASDAGVQTLDGVRLLAVVARDIGEIAGGAAFLASEGDLGVEGSRSFLDLGPDEKRAILARIDRALPDIHAAQAKIDVALDRWNEIPQNDLAKPLKTAFAPVARELPRLKTTLDEAVPLLEIALPLAGYPSRSDFLVLLQNSDEIRATGGFIGTVGKLSVDAGNITAFSFDDVYNIDNPASSTWKEQGPKFMTERMNMPKLFLRDANYTPDFPVSADRIMDFYVRETEAGTGKRPEAPTGVIALTPPVFADLLRLTGPITIDSYTFTADSYFEVLEYEVEVGFLEKGIPRNQRKNLVSKLGNELLKRISALPASRWTEVFAIATRALQEKQALIYSRDPGFLAKLDALGWTGRTKSSLGDYLWVVDTNLVSLKTDGVMEKKIEYALDAKDLSNVTASVTLRYTNHANEHKDYKYSAYRDYVRVYAPEGSEFISADGAMLDDPSKTGGVQPGRVDAVKELGKTSFGAFWVVAPGETRTLTIRYKLPPSVGEQIAGGAYRLDWQKQAGNDSAALTVDCAFSKKLKDAVPPENRSEWGDMSYRASATSETDRTFNVTF